MKNRTIFTRVVGRGEIHTKSERGFESVDRDSARLEDGAKTEQNGGKMTQDGANKQALCRESTPCPWDAITWTQRPAGAAVTFLASVSPATTHACAQRSREHAVSMGRRPMDTATLL